MFKKVALISIGTFALMLAARAADQPAGRDLFASKCTVCHGADASANTPMGKNFKIRDFRSPEVQAQSDDDITTIISKGKGKMPAFGDKLSPEQIKDLVSFIRSVGKSK